MIDNKGYLIDAYGEGTACKLRWGIDLGCHVTVHSVNARPDHLTLTTFTMQATPANINLLSQTLTSTVSPDGSIRRNAEETLRQGETQPGFLLLVLDLVRNDQASMLVRQSAGVYFKNAVKRSWDGDEVMEFAIFRLTSSHP